MFRQVREVVLLSTPHLAREGPPGGAISRGRLRLQYRSAGSWTPVSGERWDCGCTGGAMGARSDGGSAPGCEPGFGARRS